MARVKIGLKDLKTSELLQKSLHVISQISLHSDLYPHPIPSIAELEQATTELMEAQLQSLSKASQAIAIRNEKRKRLVLLMTGCAGYVQCVSEGVATLISYSGFEARKKKTPIGILETPTHLRKVLTEREGTIILRWKPVYGCYTFIVEINDNDVFDEKNWRVAKMVSKAKVTLTNLQSSKKYWVRVTAMGVRSSAPSEPFLCKTW